MKSVRERWRKRKRGNEEEKEDKWCAAERKRNKRRESRQVRVFLLQI